MDYVFAAAALLLLIALCLAVSAHVSNKRQRDQIFERVRSRGFDITPSSGRTSTSHSSYQSPVIWGDGGGSYGSSSGGSCSSSSDSGSCGSD